MATGRVALPRKRSNSHWDHTAHSESDPNKTMTLPPEYAQLAARMVRQKAGDDAAELLRMLGLDEVDA